MTENIPTVKLKFLNRNAQFKNINIKHDPVPKPPEKQDPDTKKNYSGPTLQLQLTLGS